MKEASTKESNEKRRDAEFRIMDGLKIKSSAKQKARTSDEKVRKLLLSFDISQTFYVNHFPLQDSFSRLLKQK